MRRLLSLAAIACLAALAGCGAGEDSTPTACLEGPAFYEARGDQGIPISECLTENQGGGDLANVGAAMLRAATRLNAEARVEPGGDANLQLGYLIGAAQRGADGTEGIHAELLRRLEAAALYSPADRSPSTAFLSTYRRGVEAGQRGG